MGDGCLLNMLVRAQAWHRGLITAVGVGLISLVFDVGFVCLGFLW